MGQRDEARTQRKCAEGKKQQPGREFRKQSASQAQAEESGVPPCRLLPKMSESPQGEKAEQSHDQVSMDERAENDERGRADIYRETKQSAPVATEAARVCKNHPSEKQREQQHGQSGPRERPHGIVPTRQQPFSKHPLTQPCVRHKFCAVGP